MRTRVAYAITALLLSTGVGYTVHFLDTVHAYQQSVTDYNDGFTDGVCTGSQRTATDAYGINCLTGGHG